MTNKIDITTLEQLVSNWNFPAPIRFGAGRISELAATCKELGITNPLMVSDEGLAEQSFIRDALQANENAGIKTALFCRVKSNPTGTNISDGVDVYKNGHHDGVIAIGGGSALDAGKAIALMVDQKYSIWDFEDVGDNWKRVNTATMAPVIAIPTTAGTGSEVGRSSVIVDESTHKKKIIFHPNMMPDVVIEDPAVTTGLPAHLTAATGIDAFVHNLEAYCTPAYHPMAEGIALEGMRLIKEWLPVAYENGNDLVARSHMLVASSMGATAFQKGLGGVHALAHPLGALFDKHHGLLNAILLPYVLIKNRPAIEQKIKHVCLILGLADDSFNGFIDWLLKFRQQLGIPDDLAAIGITAEEKERIGLLATQDPCAGGNPIQYSAQQYSEIFECAVSGDLHNAKLKNDGDRVCV
jgi:alcohol dehydrogenase class IV